MLPIFQPQKPSGILHFYCSDGLTSDSLGLIPTLPLNSLDPISTLPMNPGHTPYKPTGSHSQTAYKLIWPHSHWLFSLLPTLSLTHWLFLVTVRDWTTAILPFNYGSMRYTTSVISWWPQNHFIIKIMSYSILFHHCTNLRQSAAAAYLCVLVACKGGSSNASAGQLPISQSP